MPTASFRILLSIEEKDFGKDFSFDGKKIEVWKRETGYDELVGVCYSDRSANARFTFQITEEPSITTPEIFIKIFDGSEVVSYVFEETENSLAPLTEGDNPLTAVIDLDDKTLAITNEQVVCNAIVANESGDPYPNLSVNISIEQSGGTLQDLGTAITNPMGFFSYSFVKDKQLTTALKYHFGELSFKYEFVSKGQVIGEHTRTFTQVKDFSNLLSIKINLEIPSGIISENVLNLAEELGVTISETLQGFLSSNNILSLRDIRGLGGLKRRPELHTPPYLPDQETIQWLDAHAQLETLSGDYLANNYIIGKGYNSVYKISITPGNRFATDVVSYGKVSDFEATKIHRTAAAHSRLYQTVYFEKKVDAKREGAASSINSILELIDDKCNCDECEAAISPMAYLADLLWYATTHLRIDVTPDSPVVFGWAQDGQVTFENLQEIFCQSFCLSADQCDLINKRLCQYRIAIETLNCFREGLNPTDCQEEKFAEAERKYLVTAYFTLLEQLGTTYYEVRDVKNSNDEEKKQELADKLGVALHVTVDGLPKLSTDVIYFDPYNSSLTNEAFNETLETVFGFRNYTTPCNYVPEYVEYIKTWKEDFLKLQWKKDDANKDVYSLATSSSPKPLIDPDLIGPDDFRLPQTSNDAYKIWERRKVFTEKIWTDILYKSDNWTPNGCVVGKRSLKISGDKTDVMLPGKRCFITNSSDNANNKTYTIASSFYDGADTVILVKEPIPNPSVIDNTCKLNYSNEIQIASITSATQIELANGVTIADGVYVEIRNSDDNDGIYTVDGSVTSSTTVNFVESLPNAVQTGFGEIFFNDKVDLISAEAEDTKLNLPGDLVNELEHNYFVHLSLTDNNNGRYPITSGAIGDVTEVVQDNDTPLSYTEIEIAAQMYENTSAGNATFLCKTLNPDFIKPSLGARTLKFSNSPLAYEAITDLCSLEVTRASGHLPATSSFQVDEVNAGVGVKVIEPILGNEVNGTALVVQNSISVTSGAFILSGRYDSILALGALDVIIGGTAYAVATAVYDSVNVETAFTLTTSPADGTYTVTVDFPFEVSEVDMSGKKFTIPAPLDNVSDIDQVVLSAIKATKRIVIKDTTSSNANNNEYTLTSVSDPYIESSISKIDLVVEEVVWNDTQIDNTPLGSAVLKYTEKTLPLFYARPKFHSILSSFKYYPLPVPGGTNFAISYEATNPAVSVAYFPWEGFNYNSILNLLGKRDTLLNSTDQSEVDSTIAEIEGLLRLNRDSFIALANILEKYLNEITGSSTQRITTKEIEEVFNILISAAKKRYELFWYTEEVNEGIKLNYSDFWLSLTEPVEGHHETNLSIERVLIDPQLLGLSKLPDMPAGLDTIELWNERNDTLKKVYGVIKSTRGTRGFDVAVAMGIGETTAYSELDWSYLNGLSDDLSNLSTEVIQNAEHEIKKRLWVSVDDFKTIIALKKRVTPNPLTGLITNPPSLDEYEKLYQIILGAYKRKILYPEWAVQETFDYYETDQQTNEPEERVLWNHWYSNKAKLPKWRSSVSSRKEWQDSLISRNAAPTVEPDLVFVEDFVDYSNAAYSLWVDRRSDVNATITTINGYISNTGTSITEDISEALEMPDANYAFDYLLDADEAGVDIRPRLKQLHINYPAFKRLKTLAGVGYSAMTPDEKKEFISILTQAVKARDFYAAWRDEESSLPNYTSTITHSPIYFKLNKPAYGAAELEFYQKLDQWRATWKARRAWEKKLKSRIEQFENVATSLENVIEETEKQVLTIIRDALVMLCGDEYSTLADNAKALERRLLVDFSINCCQHTTRISHAIDVVQKLLWTESVGIDKGIKLNETTTLEFILDAPHFEDEWKWLGSYSTWRAAMFVFMYPENLLLPSLRRYQSPAFAKLVSDIRGNNRLTPVDACRAAKDYSYYFEDITNLEQVSTTCTKVWVTKDTCINNVPQSFEEKMCYSFGFGKKSKGVYWLNKKIDSSTEDYEYWKPVHSLSGNVVRVVGSSVYEQEPGVRHIYLFAVVHEDLADKLVYTKYDLEGKYWDTDFTELSLIDDVDINTISVLQSYNESLRPEIVLKGQKYPALYVNHLNRKGKDWEFDEWQMVSSAANTQKYCSEISGYLLLNSPSDLEKYKFDSFDRVLLANSASGYICYYIIGANSDYRWKALQRNGSLVYGQSLGIIHTNPGLNRKVQILYSQGGNTYHHLLDVGVIGTSDFLPQKTFRDLDDWLVELTGWGLSSFTLNEAHTQLYLQFRKHYAVRIATSTQQDMLVLGYSPLPSAYEHKYHVYVNGHERFLRQFGDNTMCSLFQAFQCIWDDYFTVPGTNNWDNKTRIDKNYGDTRGEMNSINKWLTEDYIKNSDEQKAQDLKWFASLLEKSFGQLWKDFYRDNATTVTTSNITLQDLIDAFLNFTVYGQKTTDNIASGRFADPRNSGSGTNSSSNYKKYEALKNVFFGLGVRQDSQVSITGTGYERFKALLPNSGELHLEFRGIVNYVSNTGNFIAKLHSNTQSGNVFYSTSALSRITPVLPATAFPITEELSNDDLVLRQTLICAAMQANGNTYDPAVNREYLREATYFVPMFLGISLSQRGQYEAALKWFKTVYNYTQDDEAKRVVYGALLLDAGSSNPNWQRHMGSWLLDPLNPHAIALTRASSYYKYTVSTIAQTFVAYANAQFTLDTVESVSKAKELYQFAAELMGLDIFKQKPDECFIDWDEVRENTICQLRSPDFPGLPEYIPAINGVFTAVSTAVSTSVDLNTHVNAVSGILTTNAGTPSFNINDNLTAATTYISGITASIPTITVQGTLSNAPNHLANVNDAVMSLSEVELAGAEIREKVDKDLGHAVYLITGKDSKQTQNKRLELKWMKDDKQSYPFDYENKDNVRLMKQRDMSFSHPTGTAAFTLSATMNPQAALDAINKYPFPYVPMFLGSFCVPVNPTYQWLSMSIELNLFKIRNCLNIAGMKRDLDPYAAPTDLYSGLPQIGANGQLVLPGTATIRPTIYRFKYLLERAKQLVGMAQQVESAFLQTLEKYDAEKYNMLRAKQDLSLAKATVKLKELQVKVSEAEVDLAILQKERSEIQVQELNEMINAGLNEYESAMVDMYNQIATITETIAYLSATVEGLKWVSDILQGQVAGVSFSVGTAGAFALAATAQGIGIAKTAAEGRIARLNGNVQIAGILASQARREQEWNFQKTLATQDIKIGGQQVKIAQDRVRVSEQDRKISELQVSNAEATIDFLNNKFTNSELYSWMSGVLEQVFSYYVSEATGVAKLAENQLAFERQEPPAGLIQGDYWISPSEGGSLESGTGPNRRGLTSSTRLSMDITKVEQYAMNTEQRKLQITKTFSLASIAPMEFQVFKETGEITFDTLMDYFDRDFPGHYLRLIKKVKVNVIALVPPTQGIKATLTSSGISHAVIGGSVFQDVIIRRSPETIALSGNRESSGMFELQQMDNEFLNPFESTGVHSRWQFKMEKPANMFDYNTIADVLLTFEYTALSSYDYEKQVKSRLGDEFSSDRAFSFRNEFSDAFYQWTHAEEFGENANEVSIDIRKFDFPANVTDLGIEALKFYVITDQSDPQELLFDNPTGKGVSVTVTPIAGGQPVMGAAGFNNKGIISTLTNGGNLTGLLGKEPIGNWKIKLNGLDTALNESKVLDVIMVITYSGVTPKWL